VENLRVPPHSIEAEQSVLGGLLLDNAALDRIGDMLVERDFYTEQHRTIYRHIAHLIGQGKPADVTTVAELVARSDDKERVGGLAYLGALAMSTPSAHNIRRYAELVHEHSIARHLLAAVNEIGDAIFNPQGKDLGTLLDEAETKVFRVAELGARVRTPMRSADELLAQVTERIDFLYHRTQPGAIIGVPTGFIDLDEKTLGLQEGDLIIVAARPSMGKTALALNIGEHVAVRERKPVAVFSMEMSGTQVMARVLGSVARLEQTKLRTGRLADEDWTDLTDGLSKLSGVPFYVDESPALNPLELRARARRVARRCNGLGLVVVDYLQLMEMGGRGNRGAREENRATEVAAISRSLKALAKELCCPVLAASQLNRACELRTDKRPVLSDLRDSGALEQDADLVLSLYRDEVYNPSSADRGYAELTILKARNGPTGRVTLVFDAPRTRFENAAEPLPSFIAPATPRHRSVADLVDVKRMAAGDRP
jgi:replicative DNA helicase